MRIPMVVPFLIATTYGAGCAARQSGPAELPAEEFAGHVTSTEQGNWFEPCAEIAGSRRLWVTYTDKSVKQIQEARVAGLMVAGERYFVRWSAAVTDERQVGPGGPALLVRTIAEVRPAAAADCPAP